MEMAYQSPSQKYQSKQTQNKSHKTMTKMSFPSVDSKRPPLTACERLRAARVLSKYAESNPKPPKSEFGSKVLEAIREIDKGKKRRSRLPEALTNLFDDNKRGLPQGKWTISNPFSADVVAVVVS